MATKKAAKKTATSTEPTAEETSKPPAKKTAAKKATAKSAEVTAKKLPGKKKLPTLTEVAELAHSYWEQRGHGHGGHVEDWLRAEKELNS